MDQDEGTTGVGEVIVDNVAPEIIDPHALRRSRRLAAPRNQHYYAENDVDDHPDVINAYVYSVKRFVEYTAAPYKDVEHIMMTQLGIKASVKAFGQK